MIWLWLSLAGAVELRAVHPGDTVASLALDLGDPALADEIRSLNKLKPGQDLLVGTLVRLPTPESSEESQTAWVVETSGPVFTSVNASTSPASLCTPLPNQTEVCTGNNGYATVRLAATFNGADHDDVNLFPNTCLTVRATYTSASRRSSVVEVTKGGVAVSSTGATPGTVAVQTSSGLTSGDAGGYRVTIEEGGSRTEAVGADVAVAGGGSEVAVKKGQGTRVKEGEAPSQPVDLLLGNQLVAPAAEVPLRRPHFEWSNTELALGYRLEVATDAAFTGLVFQQDLDAPVYSPDLFFLPTANKALYWRVASFDRMGFLGLPSDTRPLTLPAGVSQ